MNILDNIEDNTILLIPNNIKKKALEYLAKDDVVRNIKLMSFNDLKKGLLFDYTNEAIYALMKKYEINYGVSKNYLNSIYYLEKDTYKEDRLTYLLEIKKYLEDNTLLIRDTLFTSLLKSKKKLYVLGFDTINKFNKYLLDLAQKFIDVQFLDKTEEKHKVKVVNCHTMIKEIEYIAEKIAELIKEGIDINKIYIANYNDEYYFTLTRVFRAYNIPFFIKSESTLYSTAMSTYFLDNLDNNLDGLLYKIRKRFDVENNKDNEIVYNKLSQLVNNYYWCQDIKEIKELIIEEMRQTNIPFSHKKYEIKTTNILDNVFDDDEYVFLIGFNLGSIPKFHKDEDFINDDIKPEIMDKSFEYNKSLKEAYLRAIPSIKNLTVTYKESSAFNTYYPSFLCSYPGFEVEELTDFVSKYAKQINELEFASSLDRLIKFNEQSELLPVYNASYDIPYKTYDNKFMGVNIDTLIQNIDNKIKFSYSNIINYYKCPFRFYIGDILGIKEYESTLDQFIGSLFHHTLEICLESDEDVDKVYDEYVEKNIKERTPKEEFFIRVLKEEIHFVIDAIREQYKQSSHQRIENEKRIEIEINRKIHTVIKGFVDKILIHDNKAIIIDYKTSNNQKINKDYFEFGIDIQLPIYLFLLKMTESNIEVCGLYLQHILNLDNKYEPNKDFIEEKKKKLMLDGITFNNEANIALFDKSYEKSSVIKGLSITKSAGGIKNSSRILDDGERDKILEMIEGLIINCIDKVAEGLFEIQPIEINYDRVQGCKFCEYADICYKRPTDIKRITIAKGDDDSE